MEGTGEVYENRTFDKLDYQDKVISDQTFSNCIFYNCNLSKAVFEDCTFESCSFDKCDLSMMKAKRSSFKDVKITGSKAIGILWFDAKPPFAKNSFTLSFIDSNISYSSFFGMNLKKVKFTQCVAKEVDFSECNLVEADLSGTDLEGARFSDSDLSGANFINARNYAIDITGNKVKKAKFSMPEAVSLLHGLNIILE